MTLKKLNDRYAKGNWHTFKTEKEEERMQNTIQEDRNPI